MITPKVEQMHEGADGRDHYAFTWPNGEKTLYVHTRERACPWVPRGGTGASLYQDACDRIINRLPVFHDAEAGFRVLDVGCGTGYGSDTLWAGLQPCEVTGIDCSVAALQIATRAFGGNRYVHGELPKALHSWIMNVPSEPRRYADAVVCTEVIEHVEDDAGLAVAMHEALTPGGLLYLTTPEWDKKRASVMSKWHFREYRQGELEAILVGAGFQDLKRHKLSNFSESLIYTATRGIPPEGPEERTRRVLELGNQVMDEYDDVFRRLADGPDDEAA